MSEGLSPFLRGEASPGGEVGWARGRTYLAEGDLAMAGAILCVSDKHFSIVLDPALATEDVVDTGRHLVPLKVVPKPERDRAHEGSSQPALGNRWAVNRNAPFFLYQVRRAGRRSPEVRHQLRESPSQNTPVNTSGFHNKVPERLSHGNKTTEGYLTLFRSGIFESGSHCVALAGLGTCCIAQAALNPQISTCFSVHHQTGPRHS